MKYRLADICDIYDGPHATPPETDTGPIFLGIKNINEQCELDFADVKHLSESDYERWTKRVVPQEDDIVFSYEATLNRYTLIPKGFYGCLGRRLAIARVKDRSMVNPHYLYHYFCSPSWKAFIITNKVIGSTVLRVSIEDFPDYEVDLPDICIQNSVAKILDDIVDKKKNNNAICADLEEMAKLLYDYWFVQFDFPDENGKPYKSSGGKMVWNEELNREIPDGWGVKALGDIISESDKSTVQVNGAKENGKYPFFTSGSSILAYDEYFVDGFNCFLNTGGNPDVKGYKGKCAYSTDTWCINAGKYSYLMYSYFVRILPQFEQLFFAGSGLKHLQKDILKKQCLPIPSENIINKYNVIIERLWDKNTECLSENQQLASLRDFLLPMLMNGQVKVKERP